MYADNPFEIASDYDPSNSDQQAIEAMSMNNKLWSAHALCWGLGAEVANTLDEMTTPSFKQAHEWLFFAEFILRRIQVLQATNAGGWNTSGFYITPPAESIGTAFFEATESIDLSESDYYGILSWLLWNANHC